MLSEENRKNIGSRVLLLEEKLDAFSASIQQYKETLQLVPVEDYISSPEPEETGEEEITGQEPGEKSLFDGLLQDFIRDKDFDIPAGSEEETDYIIIKENTPDAIAEMTEGGEILTVNPSFVRSFDYREEDLKGCSFFDYVPEKYHKGIREAISRACNEKFGKYSDSLDDIIVFRIIGRSGGPKSVEGIFYAYESDGKPVLVLLIRDLSYSRSLFEQLKQAKDHYDALSETIGETIIRINENFEIIFVNTAVQKTFGYQREEVYGQHFSMLFPPGIFERNEDTFKKYFIVDDNHRRTLGLDVTIEMLGKSKHRGLFPMEMSFGNSKEYKGRTMTCILRDITQRKHTERKLRHLAFHDKLTGLGNRDLFQNDVSALFQTLQTSADLKAALMFLDLDGFKQVNDTLGHKAGDALLVETARRLVHNIRETDAVYRLGGDEFVVLLNSIQEPENAALVANKLLQKIREPYVIQMQKNNKTVNVGVSIGIAVIPDDGANSEIVIKNADLAMYSAKESGKNTYTFYSKEMDYKAVERWEIEQGLKKAMDSQEFFLYYQPLVDVKGHILGVEALVRWNHPEKGLIPPSVFIPIAEETGLIIEMGKWILETACRKMQYLNSRGHEDLFVSVNLSPKQFEQSDFVEVASSLISRTGIDPKNLKLELTETSIMNAPESTINKMLALREQHPGLTIAIDDFGTGYSSLSYLSQVPADVIKIDQSFVTQLFQKTNLKIVNAIINLAKSLELNVVAEGVETEKQLDYFISKGCAIMQGFYFSKPVDFAELRDKLAKDGAAADVTA